MMTAQALLLHPHIVANAVALAKVPISVARALPPRGCPHLPSACQEPLLLLPQSSLEAPLQLLVPRLCYASSRCCSTVDIPALQAGPVLARCCRGVLPVVNLFAEVVEALVEFVELCFLPLDVRAVLLELAGQGVGARLCP